MLSRVFLAFFLCFLMVSFLFLSKLTWPDPRKGTCQVTCVVGLEPLLGLPLSHGLALHAAKAETHDVSCEDCKALDFKVRLVSSGVLRL